MKLPVIKAFTDTFSFVFGNFIDIVKIMWLPLAIVLGLAWYSMPGMMEASLRMQEMSGAMDPQHPDVAPMMQAMGAYFGSMGLLFLAELILIPMVVAGILRLQLRGDRPGIVYFRFGADEIRVLVTFILQILLLFAAYMAFILVTVLATALLATVNKAAGGIVGLVAAITCIVVLIWIALRISLSVPAAVGTRSTIGIGPSWSITKGAAWALFFYAILWCVVISIVEGLFVSFTMPGYFTQIADMMQIAASHPNDPQAMNQAMVEWQREMTQSMSARMPVIMAIGALVALIIYPLMIASGGSAYALLAGDEVAAEEA